MKRNRVRLTESQLHRVIKDSVKRVLREAEEWDDFGVAYDKNGVEIHEGDMVMWVDPETGRKARYEVYDTPTEDMVKLYNKYGECEALPSECVVIR